MALTRRHLLLCSTAVAAASRAAAIGSRSSAFGVAAFSYAARLKQESHLRDPLAFLRFCRERGAGGVQIGIPIRDQAYSTQIRRYLDETGTWLEGQVRLPRDPVESERFEAEVTAAKAAGAEVVRAVLLSGRRYETFATAEDFRRFRESSRRSLELAAVIVARQRIRLAVENHKDFRADEQLELLRRIGSEFVGITLDTGNNLALLEDPHSTVEKLAPLAFTVHLKDMAVDECPEGFLLSEVPFGQGFLDLRRIVQILRKHRPQVRFNVEMATRNPLVVPCLTDGYWKTLEALPGSVLARALAQVRAHPEGRPLPRIDALSPSELLHTEDVNVRACLDYATKRLTN